MRVAALALSTAESADAFEEHCAGEMLKSAAIAFANPCPTHLCRLSRQRRRRGVFLLCRRRSFRNSIVSGQYVHTHGVDCNEAWLSPEQPNSIEQLRDGGYHTVNIGKVHAAPIRLPCGFNHRTVVENKNYKQGHHGPDGDPRD